MKDKIKKYLKETIIFVVILTIAMNALSYYRALDLNKENLNIENLKLLNNIEYKVPTNKPIIVHFWATWCPTCKFEASNIEKAGAFAIVLECVALKTAKKITDTLKIPTIGIGSSVNCDGQILVTDDMIGLSGFYPKFVKKYQNLNKLIEKGVQKYRSDVLKSLFPKVKNSY